MPRDTFFNLADDKRELITSLAIDEFAENDYQNASISRIVARAGIAKGSFYQYFDDKRDLYFYLLDLVAQEKMKMFEDVAPPDPARGFFEYLRWASRSGVDFQFANPKLAQLGYRAISNDLSGEEAIDYLGDSRKTIMQPLIEAAIQRGELRGDLDPALVDWLLSTLFNQLGHHMIERFGIDTADLAHTGKNFVSDDPALQKEMLRLFDDFLSILEHGLSTSTK